MSAFTFSSREAVSDGLSFLSCLESFSSKDKSPSSPVPLHDSLIRFSISLLRF
jgi:hypothetical protein